MEKRRKSGTAHYFFLVYIIMRRESVMIGSGAELIKQHEAVFVADLEDLYNILCMRRERGKRLLDGLLVADVSENLLVDVDVRLCSFLRCEGHGWYVYPIPCHVR